MCLGCADCYFSTNIYVEFATLVTPGCQSIESHTGNTHFIAQINFFFSFVIAHKLIRFGVGVRVQVRVPYQSNTCKYCTTTTTTRQIRVRVLL